MAKYKIEIEDGIIRRTLTFLSKEYTEVWQEEGTFCPCCLEAEVEKDIPDIDPETLSLIESIRYNSHEGDLLDTIDLLEIYEQRYVGEHEEE